MTLHYFSLNGVQSLGDVFFLIMVHLAICVDNCEEKKD